MKKHTGLASLLLLSVAVFGFAQTEKEYQGWMKDLTSASGKVRKDLAANANADVQKDAEQLETIYKNIGSFFAKRHASDAVEISNRGEMAAKELAAAAKAGDTAKMQSSMQAIGGTCGSCHTTHRDKAPDGTFTIK